jgi:hypothetical protein
MRAAPGQSAHARRGISKIKRVKKDQTKRMSEIVRLTAAIDRTVAGIERARDTLWKLHKKEANQTAELRLQKILLKWNLP